MPSREYYLKDSETEYKEAYLKYMIDVAVLMGAEPEFAEKEMNEVLRLEMALANVSSWHTLWTALTSHSDGLNFIFAQDQFSTGWSVLQTLAGGWKLFSRGHVLGAQP